MVDDRVGQLRSKSLYDIVLVDMQIVVYMGDRAYIRRTN